MCQKKKETNMKETNMKETNMKETNMKSVRRKLLRYALLFVLFATSGVYHSSLQAYVIERSKEEQYLGPGETSVIVFKDKRAWDIINKTTSIVKRLGEAAAEGAGAPEEIVDKVVNLMSPILQEIAIKVGSSASERLKPGESEVWNWKEISTNLFKDSTPKRRKLFLVVVSSKGKVATTEFWSDAFVWTAMDKDGNIGIYTTMKDGLAPSSWRLNDLVTYFKQYNKPLSKTAIRDIIIGLKPVVDVMLRTKQLKAAQKLQSNINQYLLMWKGLYGALPPDLAKIYKG